MIAEQDNNWTTGNWNESFSLMQGLTVNLEEIVNKVKSKNS